MITPGEYTLLLTDEVQRAIAANRGRDPLEVALDRNTPHARLVATQVKYLARAEANRHRAKPAPPTSGSRAGPSSISPAGWAPTPFSWRVVSAAW